MTGNNIESYDIKMKRVTSAIEMKVPDRVPIWFQDLSFFPARYAGITFEEAMYDDDKLFSSYKKTIVDMDPDMYFNPGHAIHTPGDALEEENCNQVNWPGHGVSAYHSFQFVEAGYMKAEEYDAFLDDPTDFAIRTYLPRILGTMKPLEILPPLKAFLMGYFGLPLSTVYTSPEILSALESFYKTALIVTRHNAAASNFKLK